MQIAVCDDCRKDRQVVGKLIEEYGRNRGIAIEVTEYTSGAELSSDFWRMKDFTLICLDIRMEQMDGLMTAKKIKEILPEMPIVLISEYISYALEGYKVKASRFLVKDNLEATLPECLDELLKEVQNREHKMVFPFVEGDLELEVWKIIYIETERHRNIFYTTDGVYSLYRKLDDMEEKLAPYDFVRAHRSFLINMRYVEKISGYVMRLTTGKEISVPKTRYKDVRRRYTIYKGA